MHLPTYSTSDGAIVGQIFFFESIIYILKKQEKYVQCASWPRAVCTISDTFLEFCGYFLVCKMPEKH